QLVLHLRAFRKGPESVSGDAREVHERVLPAVVGRDEPEALLVAEPLHDTSSHAPTALLCESSMREGVLPALPSRIPPLPPSAAQRRKLYQSDGRVPRLRRRAVALVALTVRGLRRRRPLRLGLVLARIVGRAAVGAALGLVAGIGLAGLVVALLGGVRLVAVVLAVVLGLGLAGRRVVAEERLADERRLGLRELAAELADGLLHVGAPDVGGGRAAVDVAPAVEAGHLDVLPPLAH